MDRSLCAVPQSALSKLAVGVPQRPFDALLQDCTQRLKVMYMGAGLIPQKFIQGVSLVRPVARRAPTSSRCVSAFSGRSSLLPPQTQQIDEHSKTVRACWNGAMRVHRPIRMPVSAGYGACLSVCGYRQ